MCSLDPAHRALVSRMVPFGDWEHAGQLSGRHRGGARRVSWTSALFDVS